ncbi:hypothetical protein BO71DRAFT_436032 [Aspergillus ellipticus CBS 707.79]|uniref:Uncharacterized protein n=1 Tax=Aspergillus ellipticus CBS 707.79 TaxID=1448320 RepID=A0A319D0R4_9EURO|nr:hypothetical protein BO71DRAFT_436032 [Aspergillus ellipticus CBS 707.79]
MDIESTTPMELGLPPVHGWDWRASAIHHVMQQGVQDLNFASAPCTYWHSIWMLVVATFQMLYEYTAQTSHTIWFSGYSELSQKEDPGGPGLPGGRSFPPMLVVEANIAPPGPH